MKVLIYGHKGWIGNQVIELLNNYKIDFIISTLRVDDTINIQHELNTYKNKGITHIFCFIGRTHGTTPDGKKYTTIDYLEQPGILKDNIKDNLYAPLSMAIICNDLKLHLTYIGTGCIFEYDEIHKGNKEQNIVQVGFNETDIPNFTGSAYSTVKGYTDRIMHLFDNKVLNLRVRMPITSTKHPRNFITKITTYEKICSISNSMTVLDDLLPLMIKMASKKITGTYNFTNPGSISHNEILELYKSIVDPKFIWKNFSLEEQSKILAGGRSNNYLDTSKLEKLCIEYGWEDYLLDIRDAVILTLNNYK